VNGDRPSYGAGLRSRSATCPLISARRVRLTRAESSCARRAGRSDRPARAGWAALRQFRLSDIPLWGERWSSGVRGERWWRPPRRRARAGFKECSAVQVRGLRQTRGSERSTALAALVSLAPNPRARGALGDQTDPLEPAGPALVFMAPNLRARARGARRASDVGQQSDPRSERPAIGPTRWRRGRRCGC
jgi:hypothetical protein